jgi:cyclophilin family peptidyl-prolyl cis-trans isomerase
MGSRTRHRAAPLTAALAVALFGACGEPTPQTDAGEAQEVAAASPEDFVAEGAHEVVVLELEDLGEIQIELLPELAPQAVANFKKLAGEGFYNGTTFHRVMPGFMIQGGDPASKNADPRDDGKGGPGYTIADEFSEYPHVAGTVSMAHTGHPNSAGSQFFIVHERSPHLDGKYSVFGRVVEGMEVVNAVTELEIDKFGRYGPQDRPYPVDARVVALRLVEAPTAESDAATARAADTSPSSPRPAS